MSKKHSVPHLEENFEMMLSGGRANSLGRTLEVVDIVLNNKDTLIHLFECYLSEDTTVRLRVSNAFKRIFRRNPTWFVEYINTFQNLVPTLNQPSAEWTLAQLHLEFCDLMTDEQIAKATTISKQQLETRKDWIVIIQSMNFLQQIAAKDETVKYWLLTRLESISKDTRKTVSKRAITILNSLRT